MPPRKVLFLVNTLWTGGTERNVTLLCEQIDRQRFLPEVWVLNGRPGELMTRVLASGITVKNLDRRYSRSPRFAIRAARTIANSDADLIHAFLPAIAVYAALSKTLFNRQRPMVYSIGMSMDPWSNRLAYPWFNRCYDQVTVNSQSVQKVTEQRGIDSGKIHVVPNGHDAGRYPPLVDRQRVRSTFGAHAESIVLIFVGRLIETKRISDAIETLAILKPQNPRYQLVIVGDGPERSRLQSLADQLGLHDSVYFAGERNDVPTLLGAADMFLFPSETEGLPNSLIEASLACLPIVACAVQGVTDVIDDQRTGLLVPPRAPASLAQAIIQMAKNPSLATCLANAARESAVQRYGISQMFNRLYTVYDRALATNATA